MQEINRIESKVVSLLKEKQLGTDLHCHFEGSLTYEDLRACAYSLNPSYVFSENTWKFIKATMASDEKTLKNFSARLTGRWIRLLAIVSYLQYNIPITTTYAQCFAHVLTKLHSQGIGLVELMVSVYTLSSDGDLHNTPLPIEASPEEIEYLPKWNALANQPTLSVEELLSLLHTTAEEHPLCVVKSPVTDIPTATNQKKMVVGLKYMIRREKETQFRNSNSELKKAITPILSLAKKNRIVGVDIAGNEYDQLGSVANYTSFLQLLKKNEIPFTIHAGEISALSSAKELGYQNLNDAVSFGARRLGHAVRLFDHTPEMQALLTKVFEKGIYIELNATSNVWTGAIPTDNIFEHPIIRALNGDHPLFNKNPELLPQLRKAVVVCDDDPVVVSQDTPALAKELAQYALYTNNCGLPSLEALLKQQYTTAVAAAL